MSIFENMKSAAKKEKPLMPVSLSCSAFYSVSAVQSPDYLRQVRLPQSQTRAGPGWIGAAAGAVVGAAGWVTGAGTGSPGAGFRKAW